MYNWLWRRKKDTILKPQWVLLLLYAGAQPKTGQIEWLMSFRSCPLLLYSSRVRLCDWWKWNLLYLANGQWTIIVLGRCISLISMNFYLYHYNKTITLTLDCVIDLDVQQWITVIDYSSLYSQIIWSRFFFFNFAVKFRSLLIVYPVHCLKLIMNQYSKKYD